MSDIEKITIDNPIELERDYRFYIEEIVEKDRCSFLDACVKILEEKNIEPKVFASRIPQYIKNKIEEECANLNKIKRKKIHKIIFE